MREHLVAGIPAKAAISLNIDATAHVYAIDGELVSVEGFYIEGDPAFRELRCEELGVGGTPDCTSLYLQACVQVHEW